MSRRLFIFVTPLAFCCLLALTAPAQRPNQPAGATAKPIPAPALPDDPKLKDLHREFILKAERLAMEYERKKDFNAAQAAYKSLLRIAPDHVLAEQSLKRVLEAQAQDKKLLRVSAQAEWQDTGIQLIAGMPVHILAKGTWTVANEVGPQGIEIAEEFKLKDNRIKLGALIGVISTSAKPQDGRAFLIGASTEFTADVSGTLFLRMYDVDPSDNQGAMAVMVRSTFAP